MAAVFKDLNDKDYVNKEAGKALKSIGYDIPTQTGWILDKNTRVNRPVLQKALQWLREKHHVSLRINWSSASKDWFYDYLDIADDNYMDASDYYTDYNEAVNAGICDVCEYIKSKMV